jgi:adenine deaminase
MQAQTEYRGRVVDLHEGRIFPGVVTVENGLVASVRPDPAAEDEGGFLCPGFVDAHVHIESSMLAPAEFGRIAVTHGTTATVSDPHEIANVLGVDGVRAMQRFAAATPLKIHFGIPSCVPATSFETAGAEIGPAEVEELCHDPSFHYLSEVMNYPGVVHGDPAVMAKIASAKRHGKRIDGHAPGLSGADLAAYVAAGIETDHECFLIDEAREKISLGQKIIIREGSAAKNFEELWPLLLEAPASCMFCSDDKHPDDLLAGHINLLCARAVAKGVPVLDVLRAACLHPVQHYGLGAGLLRPGDPADFIRLADLSSFRVLETFLNGHPVARDGVPLLPRTRADVVNHFEATPKKSADFAVPARPGRLRVIEAVDGRIVTGAAEADPLVVDGMAVADPSRDLLKIAVVNRYRDTPPAVAFVSGLGLRAGAMASSVAHDCHNIVAVGATDKDLARAVNLVIRHRGGISLAGPGGLEDVLPLPIAGIMSDGFAEDVAAGYSRLSRGAMNLGSGLAAPYMTLSFLALLVIPSLKLGDRGLFDGRSFGFVPLFTGG